MAEQCKSTCRSSRELQFSFHHSQQVPHTASNSSSGDLIPSSCLCTHTIAYVHGGKHIHKLKKKLTTSPKLYPALIHLHKDINVQNINYGNSETLKQSKYLVHRQCILPNQILLQSYEEWKTRNHIQLKVLSYWVELSRSFVMCNATKSHV